MTYRVKEMFYTLQGEGARAGRPAVFCRFTGCNLWTGHEKHRSIAVCQFCDTDFVGTDGDGGGKFATPAELAKSVALRWAPSVPLSVGRPYVVCTGGEPLLQLDVEAVDSLHAAGFEVAIETNGTIVAPWGIDWICVSPKAGAPIMQDWGNELKFVYPQVDLEPWEFEHQDFDHFYLQPMDGPNLEANTRVAIDYCLAHPKWSLSLQTHKFVGLR